MSDETERGKTLIEGKRHVLYQIGMHMLTHEQIVKAVAKAATEFPLTKVLYLWVICRW